MKTRLYILLLLISLTTYYSHGDERISDIYTINLDDFCSKELQKRTNKRGYWVEGCVDSKQLEHGLVVEKNDRGVISVKMYEHGSLKKVIYGVENRSHSLSVITAIANVESYNGKNVRMIGYLERNKTNRGKWAYFLYIYEKDALIPLNKNGFRVLIPDYLKSLPVLEKNQYVLIEGKIDSKRRGFFSGTLYDVNRIESWPKK